MAGINKIILVGHLGSDPEVKRFDSGVMVAKFSLAVTEKYKNKSGEVVESTEWFDLEAWEGAAKIAEQYLKKGSQIFAEGKQRTEKWETQTGEKRSRKIVRISGFQMLGGKPSGNNEQRPQSNTNTMFDQTQNSGLSYQETEEDDLPF